MHICQKIYLMKIQLLLLSLLLSLTTLAGKNVQVTIKWTFLNINEGYDHENKMVVYIDGKQIGESKVFKQSDKASYSFEIPKGKHTIKIDDYAMYEGKWDIHTKANQYSVDANYEGDINFTANTTINMTFDIASESSDVSIDGGKPAAGSGVPLTVSWIYENVEEGFDHLNRMEVYVDGVKIGTSPSLPESKKGTFTVYVKPGRHDVTFENYAYYEGVWELHSIDNNYSIDAFYTTNMEFKKKKRSVNLIFDIETMETTATVK